MQTRTESEAIRYQAEQHPLVPTSAFPSLETYALYLVHLAAYEYAASVSAGKAVIEVGCNTGYGTAIVARSARTIAGVDVSPRSIEEARRCNAGSNIEYRTIDASRLPFDDASFDLAISFQVIEHVFTLESYLAEIRRVLKPGAVAIFTTPNASIRLDPGMKPWNPFHVREFSASELEAVLAPWFSAVTVRGLFAGDTLYDVEFGRLQRARQNARCQQERERTLAGRLRRVAAAAAGTALPGGARRALRKLLRREPSPAPALDASVLDRYSTRDFFYKESDLDRALDLTALCVRA